MRVGTDIVEVERITKALTNSNSCFLQRVFTHAEINKINPHDPDYERASGFWAAKESIVKAVGYGFNNKIRFHDIEVTHDEYGKPEFLISGRLKEILDEQGVLHISLSISHCRTHAIAVTVLS
ncbi:holo-ACP synthase [Klebsiella variicola]|uniref:holo-ACP synthase n=1 Tax=Klebsiella TaxID=570 RepID=UPI0012B6E4D4|nr:MULTISPECIES: holo-ACP synthase [Klebsiella]MBE0114801.1 holo-[acyl-carrier-protein] synthase [Klebsiella michiganensis]MCF7099518.1 holo-ACP synthase [Klebsiella variicola]MDU4134485.1 holo-ACP synthase [Klebsiella michiganensis]HCK0912843.1 holo-ACP synthase [Klebsiella michiganensis]